MFLRTQRSAGLSTFELGRTHLLYGEWLRRRRRIKEAREQVRQAEDRLSTAGAARWAEPAHAELRAAGDRAAHAPRTEPAPELPLTARVLQVARLAAQGVTKGEIAGRLLLSPRTVGYHLSQGLPATRDHLAPPAVSALS